MNEDEKKQLNDILKKAVSGGIVWFLIIIGVLLGVPLVLYALAK